MRSDQEHALKVAREWLSSKEHEPNGHEDVEEHYLATLILRERREARIEALELLDDFAKDWWEVNLYHRLPDSRMPWENSVLHGHIADELNRLRVEGGSDATPR